MVEKFKIIMVLSAGLVVASQLPFGADNEACRDSNDNLARIEACTRSIDSRRWLYFDRSWAYTNRAVAYRKKGEYELALADLNQSIALSPNGSDTYYQRGLVHQAKKDFDLAIADFSRALDRYFWRNPRRWKSDYLNQRAIAYRSQGKFDLAMKDYDTALEWATGDPDLHYNRGLLFVMMKNNERALEDYTRAIKNAGLVSVEYKHDYLNARADLYKSEGNFAAALADYDQSASLLSSDAETFYKRALLHIAMNNLDAAMADFNRALSIFDSHQQPLERKLDYLVDRGNVHKGRGETQEALSDYEEAIANDSSFLRARRAREQLVESLK